MTRADLPTAVVQHRLTSRFGNTTTDGTTWVTAAELLADDASRLRAIHHHVVATDRAAPAAAAHYLAGWYGGGVAATVAHVLATEAAGVVLDPSMLRYAIAPGGWVDGVDVRVRDVVVTTGHRWAIHARIDRVRVVNDTPTRDQVVMTALVELVAPLIEACAGLARAGRRGLWNQVADGFGLAVSGDRTVAATPSVVAALTDALSSPPDRPWSATPRLWLDNSTEPAVCFGRKGGCCLAYTSAIDLDALEADASSDPTWRQFLRAFPASSDEQHYCNDCPFRQIDDAAARLRFWYDQSPG